MTDKRIQGFLSKSCPGDFEIFKLAGDASARRYYRVFNEDKSYVLMDWEPFEDEANYPFLSVHKLFDSHGVNVPKIYSMDKSLGLVLLEDLGDLTLERKFWENQNPEHALVYYQKSIDELVKIHYACTADNSQNWTAKNIEFNTERLLWEMNYAREHLLEQMFNTQFSEKESELLETEFTKICETLHKEPKFIAHRDYHSRNIMIRAGKTRIIDFQDARLGPIQYDLVSLLRDSYVDLTEQVAKGLLDYYLDKRKEAGQPKLDREHFNTCFELQTIQRCFKACGSFASFFNTRQDKRYLKHIKPTLNRVKKALYEFPEYKNLLNLLESKGTFEKEIPTQ